MKKRHLLFLALIASIFSFTACGPYHVDLFEEIKPNESAFLVPLEQGTQENQKQLNSLAYLQSKKVVEKRVHIPTIRHETGRGAGSYEWIPTVKLIRVDRTPVAREWTGSLDKGTSSKNQEFVVESKNSIAFSFGMVCSATILDENAATFLYFFAGKTLSQIMDDNVRQYAAGLATSAFGKRELTECQKQRAVVFDSISNRTIRYFAEYGITITNLGCSSDFHYLDEEIQKAINTQFVAEKRKDAADNDVLAAQKFAAASASITQQKMLDANINLINSVAEGLKNGKLLLPTTMSMGSGQSFMDLFAMKNMNLTQTLKPVTNENTKK